MENSEKTLKKKVSRCYFRLPVPRPFQKKVGHKLYINTSTNENPSVASLPQEKHLSFQLEICGHVGQVGAGFSFHARVESVTLWQGDASRKGESRFNLHKNEYPALGKSKFLSLKMYRTIAFVCMCVCVCACMHLLCCVLWPFGGELHNGQMWHFLKLVMSTPETNTILQIDSVKKPFVNNK